MCQPNEQKKTDQNFLTTIINICLPNRSFCIFIMWHIRIRKMQNLQITFTFINNGGEKIFNVAILVETSKKCCFKASGRSRDRPDTLFFLRTTSAYTSSRMSLSLFLSSIPYIMFSHYVRINNYYVYFFIYFRINKRNNEQMNKCVLQKHRMWNFYSTQKY